MKIYLSATYEDLDDYRGAAVRALRRLGHEVVGAGVELASDTRSLGIALRTIPQAGAFIAIVAHRYGYVPSDNPQGLSVTHLEFREAIDLKIPCSPFCWRPKPHGRIDLSIRIEPE